jgi:hypothetical protein
MVFAAPVTAGMASVEAAAGRSVRLLWLLVLLAGGARAEPMESHPVAAITAGRLTVVAAAGHGARHRLPNVWASATMRPACSDRRAASRLRFDRPGCAAF